MGIIETIFGSDEAPDYTGQAPSAETQKDIYAGQDAQNYSADKVEQGVSKDLQFSQPETFSQRAIQNRARQQYGDYLSDMKSRNERQEIDELQRQRMGNMDYVNKVRRLIKHVQDRKALAVQNQAAARNRVVGGIIGTAGAIAGGIATGGSPMGIYGGSQLGRIAGNQEMQGGQQYQKSGFGQYQSSNNFSSAGSYNGNAGLAESAKGY